MNIANTVINADNSSLASMGTDQLLDLFSLDSSAKPSSGAATSDQSETATQKDSLRTVLDNLGELWDEKQYENEYNLDNFMQMLT